MEMTYDFDSSKSREYPWTSYILAMPYRITVGSYTIFHRLYIWLFTTRAINAIKKIVDDEILVVT